MEEKNKKVICHDLEGKEYEVASDKLIFRPSVYGILIKNNKILLSKQWDGYDFPGGGIEIYETIEEALEREFFEETGIKVEPIIPVHVETSFFHPAHSKKRSDEYWNCQLIYFLVKQVGGRLSKDYFDEEEKEYADFPKWFNFKEINKIKFYNPVDSLKLIKKAARLAGSSE